MTYQNEDELWFFHIVPLMYIYNVSTTEQVCSEMLTKQQKHKLLWHVVFFFQNTLIACGPGCPIWLTTAVIWNYMHFLFDRYIIFTQMDLLL